MRRGLHGYGWLRGGQRRSPALCVGGRGGSDPLPARLPGVLVCVAGATAPTLAGITGRRGGYAGLQSLIETRRSRGVCHATPGRRCSGADRALGYATCTLVAHDWGGVVAWAFAMRHPEMLDQLVIINAPHPAIFGRELRENPAQQRASQYMLMFRSPAGGSDPRGEQLRGARRRVSSPPTRRSRTTIARRTSRHGPNPAR